MPQISFALSGGLAVLAGLLILFLPKLTRVVIGLYLIIIGLLSFISF
jgi:uncharacterized membrane protein HdeD (DUF308 family)